MVDEPSREMRTRQYIAAGILLQFAIINFNADTPEILQRRVMEQAEWILLPQAIDDIANGRLELVGGKVRKIQR